MLDLEYIRKDPEGFTERLCRRNPKLRAEINNVIKLDEGRREWQFKVDGARAKHRKQTGSKAPPRSERKTSRDNREHIILLERELKTKTEKLLHTLLQLPNLPLDEVPVGPDAKANEVVREIGKQTRLSFKPQSGMKLAESLDLVDVERAAKVSGSKFAYLQNQAVDLEFALVRFALDELRQKGFRPVRPPSLINTDLEPKLGYLVEGGEDDRYRTEPGHLTLVGTAEHSLVPYFANEVRPKASLPTRLAGFSPAYRREAGSYGKDTRGLFRVHEFDKLEMVSFTTPEEGRGELEFLLDCAVGLLTKLELPFRIVKLATGDLAAPSAMTYDLECWFPSEERYRETHSISTCTDFQARRLNIRYRDEAGKNRFVHTLNATAYAIGRTIIAILENYQESDGSVRIPKVLVPYVGTDRITR